jgi:dTDP-4-amino-4,6-dideoxygalactose transaminase/ribonuclease HI
MSNGTAALHAVLGCLGLGPGDEVVVPSCTFLSTANAVCMTGATPRFADVRLDTLTLDPASVRKVVGPRTRAILPVHFAGVHADMEALAAVARRHRLLLVEDACHALGATRESEAAGSCKRSAAAVFSFHPTKQITCGEGGMVTTNDSRLATALREFRNHGTVRDAARFTQGNPGPWWFEMTVLGHNYRMSDIHAALGLSQLGKLARFVEKRRQLAALYREMLSGHPSVVGFQAEPEGTVSSCQMLVVRVDFDRVGRDRAAVLAALKERGVGPGVHYAPVNRHPYYASRFPDQADATPNADTYYRQCLTLPLHTGMDAADVRHVAGILAEELGAGPAAKRAARAPARTAESLATAVAPERKKRAELLELKAPARVREPVVREPVVIYADGACLGNPGPAGCGVLMTFRGKEKRLSRYLGIGTNNIAELEAIRLALSQIRNRKTAVDIYTDSAYTIGVLTQPWKPKANRELIAEIRKLLNEFADVRMLKVAGHAGIEPNEIVDALAKEAAMQGK